MTIKQYRKFERATRHGDPKTNRRTVQGIYKAVGQMKRKEIGKSLASDKTPVLHLQLRERRRREGGK